MYQLEAITHTKNLTIRENDVIVVGYAPWHLNYWKFRIIMYGAFHRYLDFNSIEGG